MYIFYDDDDDDDDDRHRTSTVCGEVLHGPTRSMWRQKLLYALA